MTAGVYVASRASVSGRAAMWRAIRERGASITSTWIDEDGPGQTPSMSALWDRITVEVASSTHLVLYVEPGDLPLKGALVEVGMALAAGLEVRVVARGFADSSEIYRLVGSWVEHPQVSFFPDPETAVRMPKGLLLPSGNRAERYAFIPLARGPGLSPVQLEVAHDGHRIYLRRPGTPDWELFADHKQFDLPGLAIDFVEATFKGLSLLDATRSSP